MNVKKQAKKFMRRVLKYYAAVGLKMELDFFRAVGDLFVFLIDFVPGTTENKIRQYLKDVQQALGLQLFQLHREGKDLFFVASEINSFDNRTLGILTSPSYAEHVKGMKVPYPIGFNVMRRPVIVDLVLYSSWLLGGAGYSGKTTGIQSWIASILWSCCPEDVNLIIIDEPANFTQYAALPHLSCPVIHNTDAGYKAVMKVYAEMKRRQRLKVENPAEFQRQPILIFFIDECVSFVAGAGSKQKILADTISLLLRLGRHSGIYLVLATQNPSLDEMKCDLSPVTSRIAFTCGKPQNSVTILGEGGAEKLNGNGELYFISQKHSGLMYVKGAYITSDEIDVVCDHVRKKYEESGWDDQYHFTIDPNDLLPDESDASKATAASPAVTIPDIDDKTFTKIIMWAFGRETVSANAIHAAFNPGQRKAGRLVERLYKLGIAGEANRTAKRKVLPVGIEDLPEEVISFLDRQGYNANDIKGAFGTRRQDSGTATVVDVVGAGNDNGIEQTTAADTTDTGN